MSHNTLSKIEASDEEQKLRSSYEATQMMLCELNTQFLALREENQKLQDKLLESRTTVDAQQARINELDEQNLQLRSYFGPTGTLVADPAAEIARLQHLLTHNEELFQGVVNSPSFRIGKALTSILSPIRKILGK
jgi:DNA repair exonuclease SbcCD ATPase subunit